MFQPVLAQGHLPITPMTRIQEIISDAKSKPDERTRVEAASELVAFVYELNPEGIKLISAAEIDEIATLLTDPNDAIKSRAAKTLGKMGAHANRALPALRNALSMTISVPLSEVIGPSLGPEWSIRKAIIDISGEQQEVAPYFSAK